MNRKVVLVVEDNADELMIYTTMLSHRGYGVLAARDYEAALEIARSQQPELAVVDVNLGDPRRDGCDLVQALRHDPATAGMQVIAHTAFGDLYRRALQRAGCARVLHKPTRPSELLETVVELIGAAHQPAAHPPSAPRSGDA
jgi:two-component system, cell cycle response regulator DivK